MVMAPLKNFEQRVRLYSSTNGTQWQPLAEEAVIFDYSRFMDVRNVEVVIPPTDHRHFRIVFDNVTSEQESELLELTRQLSGQQENQREERVTVDRRPFRIDQIKLVRERVRERVTGNRIQSYAVENFEITEDAEKKQTIILVGTRRQPLTSFQIETGSANFRRRIEVQVEEPGDEEPMWRTIATSTVSRIKFKNLQREQTSISFSESRRRKFRIVIQNQDSPPLEITGVTARGTVQQLLFLAHPRKSYQLAYGSSAAVKPVYDTAAMSALLREGFDPTIANLGPELKGAGAPLAEAAPYSLLRDTRVFIGLIIVLVLVLGVALLSASRRLDSLPPDGKEKL